MKSFKKFLLLGHEGYLGSYLLHNLECNILNNRKIYNDGNNYDFIINCIGKPDIKFCESNPITSQYSNCNVISDIKKLYPKSKIINFSSYYVYDDYGLCTEFSKTSDSLIYSKHKLESEKLNNDGINFRLGKLFGNTFKNQKKLTEIILHEKKISLDDVIFNPVSVKCVCDIFKNIKFLNDNFGIFNLANEGVISHYDYGKYIIDYLDLDTEIYKAQSNIKPFSNHGKFTMSLDKIKTFINLRFWQDDMSEYLNLLQNTKSV